jgi:hypothetical protein
MRVAGFLLVLAGFLAGSVSPAFARPDITRMTCAQARTLVARSGAVVATTGRHTYQRFVNGPRWCDHWEVVRPATARTRDNPGCVVGYICETPLFRPFGNDW